VRVGDLPPVALLGLAGLPALLLGPWLARVSVRLAARDESARAGLARTVVVSVLLAAVLAGAVLLAGLRPATVALAWAGAAGIVLGAVDLAVHRLPDRVVFPAAAAVAAALLADAAVLGTWPDLLRAGAAGAAAGGGALLAALLAPAGLGLGDVKLLGLLGLVLGWVGWGALLAGVLLGLVVGAAGALALVATRRAGWRTAVPFGPPLIAGAVLALALAGPVPLS
jgi:leader peptidase (prepilin peptidase) / N-methyltransferase